MHFDNHIKYNSTENKPYAFLVDSLIYAQVCIRPDLAFAVSLLERYLSNHGLQHWIEERKVLRYTNNQEFLLYLL